MRYSTVTTLNDPAGHYEVETFSCEKPKHIILGVHGNGVRRWDGEKFYYALAEHFTDSIVVLVDQNQPEAGGCRLNSLDILIARNQLAQAEITKKYPTVPVYIVAHSMGCGVASLMDVQAVTNIIFVAPAVGALHPKYIQRYGSDITNGKIVTSSDGLYKNITKEFMDSVKDIVWQESYAKLLSRYPAVHVFESGADEIIDEERYELRNMPFASYEVIDGAPHNYSGRYAQVLFSKIERLL